MSKQNPERTNWLGVCLLVIGIAYLNKHYHWDFYFFQDFLPVEFYSWPSILIIVGFCLLLFGRSSGLVLMLLGALFLFPHEFTRVFREFHHWWPLLLIIAGLLILFRSGRNHRKIDN